MPLKFALTAFAAVLSIALAEPSVLRADEPAAPATAAKPKATAEQFVTVELTVVEVSLTKLRAIGFDWFDVNSKDHTTELLNDAKKWKDFLQALEQHASLKVLRRPTLETLSGQPAFVAVGNLKLDVVPIVLDSGRIRVEYRLNAGGFASESTLEIEPGKARIANQVRTETNDAAGKVQETATIVIVRADTKAVVR